MNPPIKSLFLLFLILSNSESFGQKMSITMGLESDSYYEETKATQEQNSAFYPPTEGKEEYRFFKPNETHKKLSFQLESMHFKLWNVFEKRHDYYDITKEKFMNYARENDEYYIALATLLAPEIYFDFIGESGKEYVLQTIIVKTIQYDEYRGGGFFLDEAWYDIELVSKKGKKSYPVDKKLKFTGSGRAELRFSNDKFVKSVGLSPMGNYFLEITFVFLSDGKKTKVKSDRFKIDV